MELRDYQIKAISDIRQAWKDGYKSPCLVAPCGAGKSVTVSDIAKRTTENKKQVMFIVHRKELCDQIRRTFEMYGVDMNYCSINMIQTLVKNLDKVTKPDLIIIDENHHSPSGSYLKVLEQFKDVYKVGVTATPIRLDGTGMQLVNDKLIESVTAKWLIENKYLSPARLFSAPLANFDMVKQSKGDFDAKASELLMDKSCIYGDIIKTYNDKASGKKAIAYCVTVEHSKNTAQAFNNAGISAESVDGTTPTKIRDEAIQNFRDGKIQILCNCELFGEGLDIPDCECVILLRPTQSLTLYIQSSMRCMRYKEGKEAIILDHVANNARHGLPWIDREWTLEGKKKVKKQKKEDCNIWTCEKCFYTWEKEEGRNCPLCGEELSLNQRKLEEQREIELVEMNEKMHSKERKEYREKLKKIQLKKGYKKGWVWHMMDRFDKIKLEVIQRCQNTNCKMI
jgi:superfamily II DNA or RNA helicase